METAGLFIEWFRALMYLGIAFCFISVGILALSFVFGKE